MQVNLFKLRKEASLTQKDMASKLGISATAYRQKESGLREFKMSEMFIIARLFKKDIGDIFTE